MELGASSEGATSIDPDELADLKPAHIATRDQLNEWEQLNIREADEWLFSPRRLRHDFLLSDATLRRVHTRMFNKTWKWAGRYRLTSKNIGIDAVGIAIAVRDLCGDARFWIDHQSYGADEIALRFHHRLVLIHPFVNGNGRHARLLTDAVLESLGRQRFSWGGARLETAGSARTRYLSALRAADRGDFELLRVFVRS